MGLRANVRTRIRSELCGRNELKLAWRRIVGRAFPEADAEAMATATWALVHGLAFLHLDGKLDAPTPSAVAERVTSAVEALLTAAGTGGRSGRLA